MPQGILFFIPPSEGKYAELRHKETRYEEAWSEHALSEGPPELVKTSGPIRSIPLDQTFEMENRLMHSADNYRHFVDFSGVQRYIYK